MPQSHVSAGRPDSVPASPSFLRVLSGRGFRPFEFVSLLLAFVFAALVIYPLSRVLGGTFIHHGVFDFAPIKDVFIASYTWILVRNTFIVTVAAESIALVVGFSLAWLNERTDARIGVLTDALPLLPFFLPAIAGAIGWVFLLSPQAGFANVIIRDALKLIGIHLGSGPFNIYTWGGLIFVYALYMVPYGYLIISVGLRNLDPALEEQARVCGSGKLRTLFRVTLPAIKPNVGGAILLMTLFGMALFSVPMIIGTTARIDVLSVAIVRMMTFSYPPDIGGATSLALVIVLVSGLVWYLQTRVLRGARFATIGGKGVAGSRIRLGKWRWGARALMLAYVVIASVLPVVALLLVALNGFWTPNIQWSALSLSAFRQTLFHDIATQHALRDSVTLAVVGATIGMVLAALFSVAVRRTGPRIGRVIDGWLKLPAALPHVVFAIGFILAFAGPPFRLGGTLTILLLAYIVLYMPEATIAADTATAQIGRELQEASHTSGAGAARTFFRVNLPLMVPGLIAGWALLYVLMMGDINASVILAGTGNEVVGFRILEIFEDSSYASMAVLATTLTAISAVVVTTALLLARRAGVMRR